MKGTTTSKDDDAEKQQQQRGGVGAGAGRELGILATAHLPALCPPSPNFFNLAKLCPKLRN